MDILQTIITTTFSVLLLYVPGSEGRGRLMDPPARSSMWRFGFKTPINYNDNALNCGGLVRQWSYNKGQCGVCGDPYDGNRDNERGGKYVTDILAKTYTQGQTITVTVDVTANEGGWFQFHLCPDSNPRVPVTEKCLQEHLLQLSDGTTRYHLNPTTIGSITLQVKLPSDVYCDRCVFRWMWNAGNTWGVDPDGTACVGCGRQEQFYGCSDVAIRPSGQQQRQTTLKPTATAAAMTTATMKQETEAATSPPTTTTTTASTSTTTTTTTTAAPQSTSTTTATAKVTTMKVTKAKTTPTTTTKSPKEVTTAKPKPSTQKPSTTTVRCKAINDWLGIPAFDQWCDINCNDLNICLSKNCLCFK